MMLKPAAGFLALYPLGVSIIPSLMRFQARSPILIVKI